ncbi:MAG: spermidine/putrescine transport system ATP-binding protein [Paracoccaceae bacterium]|jgi:spermidine/putrescine transport system ATP-binding protein
MGLFILPDTCGFVTIRDQKGKTIMTTKPDQTAAIDARGVSKIFGQGAGKVVALDNVSIEIQQNEFFTLLGPSGCGKTTLLRLIAGFDHPTSGQIMLHGDDISLLPPYERPINTVFQNYALFPHMTASENISFGLLMQGRPKSEIAATVAEMLQLVQMQAMKDRKIAQLSGGQQQRIALARALAPRPKVLLLDEPLSALDSKLRKEMQIELKRLQHETGITFIFVTHDQEEALTMSDNIAVMRNGQVLQVGSPRQIYDHPADHFVADFIGETNILGGTLVSVDDGIATVKLPSGTVVQSQVPNDVPLGPVTLAIRPEHVTLAKGDGNLAKGRVTNAVYFGTDTHVHLTLDGFENTNFIARVQNRSDGSSFENGEQVGLSCRAADIQILRN